MRHLTALIAFAPLALAPACTTEADVAAFEDSDATAGTSIGITPHLSGCHGQASSSVPSDGQYVMTTFGGGTDNQRMSCGGYADGAGWYAASRQRYGCGARLQVEANGKCVVVSAMDYGPDVCVEAAAHSPILDLSPRAARLLWNTSGAGWSDHLVVTVTEVPAGTPLGECVASDPGSGSGDPGSGSADPGGGGTSIGAACSSATLGRDVADGECVQSAADDVMYQCASGSWVAADTATCTTTYADCQSATLGRAVPPRTCVQSGSSGKWYQCNGQGWVAPVDTSAKTGPIGACAGYFPTH